MNKLNENYVKIKTQKKKIVKFNKKKLLKSKNNKEKGFNLRFRQWKVFF